ncbi:MAG: aldo/keto reductase [Oscillospiraceae bacterium]|nr:aldo/keto reductase [Oscillospiraceae bacterium]
MEYRINRRTGDRISEIGIGSSYMFEAGMEEAVKALRRAVDGGINYFDLAAGDGATFPIYGEALHDVRDRIFFQIHFGADYTKGTYGWSLDLDIIKRSVDRQLKELRTDHIDYGFIHCQDEVSDWETYLRNGVYDYILLLQRSGVVKHIGLSSHTPSVIQRILDDAEVDMLMFSVNPAYDYGQGEFANGSVDERSEVYRRCEKEGIGISVMKPFSGGQLLDAGQSPFGKALSQYQCIRYCLDKPGVLTVLPGAHSVKEVESLLAYYDQPEEATDYSVIGTFAPPQAAGKCVYCNHCKPCPMGIDIGLVNKYYDLAKAGDAMAIEHYRTLEKNASDCIQCGHCDSRCPFSVRQSERMQLIREYMDAAASGTAD